MPVRTRSQRIAEEGSDSNGSAPVMTESSRKPRKKPSRRSARLAKKQQSKEEGQQTQTEEAKSEEIQEPTTTHQRPQTQIQSTEIYDDDDNDDNENDEDLEQDEIKSNNRSNVEDLRRYVQDYLETPDRVQMPRSRIQHIIEPSPRIDAITINNKSSKMQFLVPPRKQQEPIEIRQQVRNLLSPDNVPMTTQQLDSSQGRAPSRSPSLPYDEMSKYGDKLRQDKTTRLWSPYAPNFNKEEADRTARLLITLMFVISIAVLIKIYQTEIIEFLKPFVQDLKQFVMGLLNKEVTKTGSESIETEEIVVDETEDIGIEEQPEQDSTVTR